MTASSIPAASSCTPPPTLAEALALVATWDDLAPARRRDLATALRTLREVAGGAAPGRLPLEPGPCLALLAGVSPVALGISPASLRNRTAALRAVLRRLGLLAPVQPRPPVADPAWAALVAALPRRFQPHRLRAFMAWCAGAGIAPAAVGDDSLLAFLHHRQRTHGGPNLRADAREVARQWNRMREALPGWPAAVLALPPLDRPAAPPFDSYLPSLVADVAAFAAWAGCDPDACLDLAAEDGRPALAAATVAGHVKALRLLLWGAVETGHPPESFTSLRDLLEPRVAADAVGWHLARLGKPDPLRRGRMLPTPSTGSYASVLGLLLRFCRIEAHEATAKKIQGLMRRVRPPRQTEVTPRVAAVLEATEDPGVQRRLARLPATLMAQARRLRDGTLAAGGSGRAPDPRGAASLAALAAALQILLVLPLRAADLAALRIGPHWRWVGGGRTPMLHLGLDTAKTGMRVEHRFAGAMAALLAEYERDFRPLGPHAATDWLFPARDRANQPRHPHHFSEAIANATWRHAGVRLTIHNFRAQAAETILAGNPTALEDVRLVLGHSTFSTAARHYRRRDRLGSGERLGAIIAGRARPGPAPTPPAGLDTRGPRGPRGL